MTHRGQDRSDALRIIHNCLRDGKSGRLAVAESLTAGLIQAAIGGQSGASAYFQGGVTAYQLDHKVRILGVDRAKATECNSVSQRVAEDLAGGAFRLFDADITVGTTGYAEADPARGIHTPFAYFAIIDRGILHTGRIEGPGCDRQEMRDKVTTHVLCELAALLEASDKRRGPWV